VHVYGDVKRNTQSKLRSSLSTRESKTVDAGKASGKATAGAWEKEYKGEVRCLPPPPHQSVRVSC